MESEPYVTPGQLLLAKRNRSFVGRREYPTEADVADALRSAKEALPEVESACDAPRWGRTVAVLVLMLAWPFVAALLAVVCVGLAVGFAYLAEALGRTSAITAEQIAHIVGLGGLALDALLVLVTACVPGLVFARLGRFLRARHPRLGAFLSAVAVLPVSALLFLPLVDGDSIAPANISYGPIPLRWLILIGGLTVVPVLAAGFSCRCITRQRFCRLSGKLLSAARVVDLAFDCAEDAVELLDKGTYERVAQLSAVPVEDDRHCAQVVLWQDIRAATALLELKVFFWGHAVENAKPTRAKWLAFSAALDREASDNVCAAFPA